MAAFAHRAGVCCSGLGTMTDAREWSMLREKDTRGTASDDVMATLAALDEKLEALERGMAAARGGTLAARPASGPAAPDPALSPGAVADFQAAARSRYERRLSSRMAVEAFDSGPADATDPAEARAAYEATFPSETASPAAATVPHDSLLAAAGPRHTDRRAAGDPLADPLGDGGDPYPEPEFGWKPELLGDVTDAMTDAREVDADAAGVPVTASELSGWRERLGRAIDELAALRFEIELASSRLGAIADADSNRRAAGATPPAPDAPTPSAAVPVTKATSTQSQESGPAMPMPARPATPARPDEPPPVGGSGQAAAGAAAAAAAAAVARTTAQAGSPDRSAVGPIGGVRLPVPMPHDRLFEGRVLVDAGPFLDIAAVTAFQRALELVPGARGVDVTALDLDRAHLELELSDAVALGREIRAVFPFNFAIFEAGHGRLSINVDTASPSARQHPPISR
jgi:hypothetical protein